MLKLPKYGNCSVTKENTAPLITLNELKSIYKTSPRTLYQKMIQTKLNDAIVNNDWDFYDLISCENDYLTSPILN